MTPRDKILIQDLWKQNLGWDDQIKHQRFLDQRLTWDEELIDLPYFHFHSLPSASHSGLCWHTFYLRVTHVVSDASEKTWAAVAYMTDDQRQVHVAFVPGRSRLSPKKKPVTPHLKLSVQTGIVIQNKLI